MEANRDRIVGVIGLGAMGSGVAARLIERGLAVVGYDISEERNRKAARTGVLVAEGLSDVARRASRLVCLVDTSAQVEEVVASITSLVCEKDVFICMATINLVTIQNCAERLSKVGCALIDAPVSGGAVAARAGKLQVMVGACDSAVGLCRPILEAISARYYHMGEVGAGFAAKMVNNILGHSLSVAIVEGMILGTKVGLDPQQMYELISASTGDSALMQMRVPRILKRDFEGVPLSVAYREMVMETGFARLKGVPTPLANMAEQVYLMAMNSGLGHEDGAALVKLYERWTDLCVASHPTGGAVTGMTTFTSP
jgi:3-hydroxyisobutyrate dehydrogenase